MDVPIPRNSSPDTGKFFRAYSCSTYLLDVVVCISSLGNLISGAWQLHHLPISVVLAFIPFIPLMRKGGIWRNPWFAVWISRGYAVIFLIAQISIFIEFTRHHGEGSNGEGAPLAFILAMVVFSMVFLCPWLLTALRSFSLNLKPLDL